MRFHATRVRVRSIPVHWIERTCDFATIQVETYVSSVVVFPSLGGRVPPSLVVVEETRIDLPHRHVRSPSSTIFFVCGSTPPLGRPTCSFLFLTLRNFTMACSDLRGKWRRRSCPKPIATSTPFYEVEEPGWKGRNERGIVGMQWESPSFSIDPPSHECSCFRSS